MTHTRTPLIGPNATVDASVADPRLVAVLDEYVAALERGDDEPIASVVARHADLGDELAECLEGVRVIHGAVVGARAGKPASGVRGEKATAIDSLPIDAEAPREIGDYLLVREIGRGGMGVVYEAVERSLRRRVALKVLPFAAVLDQRQITRFRNEAQAAAQLHHPHIVPVFAIGQERGVHYYAMQHIEGQSVAQAIAEMRAEAEGEGAVRGAPPSATTIDAAAGRATPPAGDPTQGANPVGAGPIGFSVTGQGSRPRRSAQLCSSAKLAADAADALQHAHDYGVVHRDIKPSNLLLDRQGKVWVADFGLARMQSDLGVTHTGDVVGTLRYMSPEQARGRADQIDGRTDVYALGATLYELVTLEHAHRGESRQELLDRVERHEPVAPRRLNAAIPIDLETIILRAMAKDRDARYATARELADDLRRFLDGRPTVARPPSGAERVARWLRRHHRVVAAAVACLAVVAACSLVGALLVYREQQRTSAALAESQHNAARAEKHYHQARGLVELFGGDLADRVATLPGSEGLRRRMLQDTLAYYEEFLADAAGDPTLAVAVAQTRVKAAAASERLGRLDAALASYDAAEVALRERLATEPGDHATLEWLGRSTGNRGRLLASRGESQAARLALDEAIALGRELLAAQPKDPQRSADLAEALSGRAMVDGPAGASAASRQLREAIGLLEHAHRVDPANAEHSRRLAVANDNLSFVLRASSATEALAASDRAAAILEALVVAEPGNDAYRCDMAMAANNRGAIAVTAGDWDAAIEAYERAVRELDRLTRRAPLVPRHRSEQALAEGNLAMALARDGKADESDRMFDDATRTLEGLVEDFPAEDRYRRSLAAMWNNRGVALRDAGRLDEASVALGRSIELEERRLRKSPGSATLLATHYANQAQVLGRLGRIEEAAEVHSRRIAIEKAASAAERIR
ncbi:MAG: protein kinase domain-containing protein [Lacipirellulaceae bacterium]